MWISKKTETEIELKSFYIILPVATVAVLLAGTFVVLTSAQRGDYSGGSLGLLLAAAGLLMLFFLHYENSALFDKGRGKFMIIRKALLSKKDDIHALEEIERIKVVKIIRYKQSHDELRILLKNGKEILLMGAAPGDETMKNATQLAAFLNLPLEESENSESLWQGKSGDSLTK